MQLLFQNKKKVIDIAFVLDRNLDKFRIENQTKRELKFDHS